MTDHHTNSNPARAWLLALLLTCMPAGLAVAAEEPSEQAEDERTSQQPTAESADKTNNASNGDTGAAAEGARETEADADRDPAVFIPSEEISEDFAVSFPVDI